MEIMVRYMQGYLVTRHTSYSWSELRSELRDSRVEHWALEEKKLVRYPVIKHLLISASTVYIHPD